MHRRFAYYDATQELGGSLSTYATVEFGALRTAGYFTNFTIAGVQAPYAYIRPSAAGTISPINPDSNAPYTFSVNASASTCADGSPAAACTTFKWGVGRLPTEATIFPSFTNQQLGSWTMAATGGDFGLTEVGRRS